MAVVSQANPIRRLGFLRQQSILGQLSNWKFAILISLIATGLSGCRGNIPSATAPPPPDVSVAYPVQKDVVEWDTYTGYLQAPEMANVAARVSGLIVEMPFEEGSIVKKGDLIAKIDERPFKADLDSKKADEQKTEAALAIANVTYQRLVGLQKGNSGAVSQQDLDNAQATVEQTKAAVEGAKAAVESSRLNLEWCRVLSPIDGRVSYKWVTVGNLVNGGAGQAPATLLTSVQSVSPVYCYVDVDEHSVLKYQKLAAERSLVSARNGKIPCYLQLASESGFPHKGVIDFLDNHVDPTTGTMRMRGIFENQSGTLIPGLFARLSVPGSGRYHAVLVPDTAIGNDQSQRDVLVVDKDNKVSVRPVTLGASFGDLRSIVSGVSAEDRIVVNGQMHARPGAAVSPIEVQIKVDEAAFADPGSEVAGMTSTNDTNSVGSAASAYSQPNSAKAATGNRE
jgi:membrane fusion protein, multidrug efflux system